jgi:hypothetical protein
MPRAPLWLSAALLLACTPSLPPPIEKTVEPAPAASEASRATMADVEREMCARAAVALSQPPTPLEQGLRAWLGDGAKEDAVSAKAHFERGCGKSVPRGAAADDGLRLDGDAAACAVLGVMYDTGDGIAKDPVAAVEWYERAAQGGLFDLGGCELAAPAFTEGIGSRMTMCCRVARSFCQSCAATCRDTLARYRESTIAVLDRACERGRGAACFLSAMQYGYGLYWDAVGSVVEPDAARARTNGQRACDAGIGRACAMLAMDAAMRFDSDGNKPADATEATTLFKKGCDLGSGPACISLARVLADGWNGPKDPPAAMLLYKKACTLGMRRVCKDLEKPSP